MKYDVIIIGAGSGGLSARREVAKKTDKYLVIDGGELGTTCARVGCMPSKVLIQAAEDFHRRAKLAEQGISGAEGLKVETKKTMQHVRKLRDRFVRGVLGGMDSWGEKHFVKGMAQFVSTNEVEVDGKRYQADKFIIATGSKPNIPATLRGLEKYCINTDYFFELEELPARWAVVGLGVIGIELGQSLSRLGLDVTGIARREIIAGISDPAVNQYAIKKFSEELKLDFCGIKDVKETSAGLKIRLSDKSIVVDKVLITAGRRAVWDNLNLQALGLEQGEIPEFDKGTLQLCKYPHIYVAGDNTGEHQILHEASDEGRIAGYNTVHEPTLFKRRTPLLITFSDPNIASTGKTFSQLTKEKRGFEIGEVSFEGQGRSIVKLKEIGMLRIYGDISSGEILGAEMMGPSCEHIAHLLSWVISNNMTVNQVLALPFYHPVIEEGLRTALRDLRSKVDEPQPDLELFPEG